jgi:PKD repeat protein
VNLTVINGGGTASKKTTITVLPKKPIARFIQDRYSGRIPLTVTFTDTSLNNPTSHLWRFGDGETSRDQNPTHSYKKAGIYIVRLTATNSAGSDSATSMVAALPNWWFW